MSSERPIVELAPIILRASTRVSRIARVALVDVPASGYVRGCSADALSHGTLLDEAIRFLDFGTAKEDHRTPRDVPIGQTTEIERTLIRNHASFPADSKQLQEVIASLANELTPAFYEHVRLLYDFDGTSEGLCSKRELGKLVRFPPGANQSYVERLSMRVEKGFTHDRYQVALLVPRLICDSWATESARARIFDFTAVEAIHMQIRGALASIEPSRPEVIASEYARDHKIPFDEKSLMSSGRIGAARTLVPDGDQAGFLFHFADPAEIGLTEKIVATLTTLALRTGPLEPVTTPPGRAGTIAEFASVLDSELDKLLVKPAARNKRNQQQSPPVQLATRTWIKSLLVLQTTVVLPLLARVESVVEGADAQAAAISDLLWALILIEDLVLWLLHMQVVTLLAAIPFRQMYEGGLLLPLRIQDDAAKQRGEKQAAGSKKHRTKKKKLDPVASVDGILGATGIAFWEYLGGDDTPHIHHASARNSFSPQLTRVGWVPESAEQARTLDVTTRLNIDDRIPARLDEVATPKGIAFFEHLGPTVSRYLDRIATVNRVRLPSQRRGQSIEDWRSEIDRVIDAAVSAGGKLTASVSGPFPITPEINPRFHDSIYVRLGAPLPLLDGWGGPGSSIGFGAKLECHLQAYVFAWLYRAWLDANRTFEGVELASSLVFTCACLPYGGKFPPHITHRDGYGFDFSLIAPFKKRDQDPAPPPNTGKLRPPYYWAIHWPQDTTPVGNGNRKSLGEDLLAGEPLPLPLGRAATSLRRHLKSLGPAARPILDRLGVGQPQFTIDDDGTPNVHARTVAGKSPVSKVIPREALVASWNDSPHVTTQLRNRAQRPLPRPNHRASARQPVFREFLREYIDALSGAVEKLIPTIDLNADDLDERIAKFNGTFARLETSIDDWPIMPDAGSHLSHHFGHLALLLSFPREVIWASPLYHLRAMNAIVAELAALGLPSPFVSAGGIQVEDDFTAVVAEMVTSGPLPIPKFLFLPHNHHHHWHVNFWAPETKATKPQEELHLEHLLAAMPYWRLLGVDFDPFVSYLDKMKEDLESARGPKAGLMKRIEKVKEVISKVPKDIVSPDVALNIRNRIFASVASRWLPSRNPWAARTQWPTSGSPLDTFTKASRELGQMIQSYQQRFQGQEGNPTREEIADWLAQIRHEDDEVSRQCVADAMNDEDELEEVKESESLDYSPLEEWGPVLDANQLPISAD